jgi:type II secretory pathway pseudopilin PulG
MSRVHSNSRTNSRTSHFARAFTLTELLVAVGVLVVVIVAAARIFSASSRVSGISQASADLLQTAAAIEAQVRADFANLPKNGFMVIQQVEVNPANNPQTIEPSLGPVEIRADQVAFFARGVRATTRYTGSQESSVVSVDPLVVASWVPEAAVARIYYGHGVTAPTVPVGFDATVYGSPFPGEPNHEGAPLVPWQGGRVETVRWDVANGFGPAARMPVTRPSNWPLARVATLLGTDGHTSTGATTPAFGSTTVNSTQRLFTSLQPQISPLSTAAAPANLADPLWTSNRVDIVKWQMDDLFSQMAYQYRSNGTLNRALGFNYDTAPASPWAGPSTRLRMIQTLSPWATPATANNPANGSSFLFVGYPRVEKAALGPSKAEQMLTAPVLAPNCSSFKVEWTWDDGVGRTWDGVTTLAGQQPGDQEVGMFVPRGSTQPWFGLNDPLLGMNASQVRPATNMPNFGNNGAYDPQRGTLGPPLVIDPDDPNQGGPVLCSVEGAINNAEGGPIWRTSSLQGSKRVYHAVFGFNQDNPGETNPYAAGRGPYTPLPSALRITLRLHDPLGRIEGGRDYQFIVELPKR